MADLFPKPLHSSAGSETGCVASARSSWLMKPEQVAHFDLEAGRKKCLVVNSLLWKSSIVTLLLVENLLIQMLLDQTISPLNDGFIIASHNLSLIFIVFTIIPMSNNVVL